MKGIKTTLSGMLVAMGLLACAPANQEQTRTHEISSNDRLSATEWATYTADMQYVHRLAPAGTRVHLNYADPRQYNFVMARLKLAGKTASNSPHLFELLAARRDAQIKRGLAAGVVTPVRAGLAPAARSEMHYLEETDPGSRASANGPLAIGTASSTFIGGTAYTYVDVSISTSTGRPIAPLAYTEEFASFDGTPGTNVTTSTSGATAASNVKQYNYDSYKLEDPGDGSDIFDSLVHEANGAAVAQPLGALPQLSAPVIAEPVDHNADHLISICMDRAWTNDCDVILHGGAQSVQVPLKGSIGVGATHVFDTIAIAALQTMLNSGQDPANAGFIKLVLTNVGGGCDVTDGDTLYAKMATFWNRVTWSADRRVLSWDMTDAYAAYFDDGCRQVQDRAKLTMRIPVPLKSVPAGEAFQSSFTITNDPDTQRPNGVVDPITLTNSCLAEGTQIELADGKLAAIEALHIGQDVYSPYARTEHALTITDTAVGSERAPMVRIRDDAGHALLMTEMHPIATPDRGMVQARALRAGDRVMTTSGARTLVEVGREAYAGKVYNLKVGSPAQMAGLVQDQTVVYANGFVVGDGQIQSKYEALAQHPAPTPVTEAWRRDYDLAPRHK